MKKQDKRQKDYNGAITISCNTLQNNEEISISIRCRKSRIKFVEVTLTAKQFIQAIRGLGDTSCVLMVNGLDKVGKVMEHKEHIFEVTNTSWYNRKEKAMEIVESTLPEGWVADKYFSSKNSFFSKGGKEFARTTIRRWIAKE